MQRLTPRPNEKVIRRPRDTTFAFILCKPALREFSRGRFSTACAVLPAEPACKEVVDFPECQNPRSACQIFRISDFGFLSDFGFRASEFPPLPGPYPGCYH